MQITLEWVEGLNFNLQITHYEPDDTKVTSIPHDTGLAAMYQLFVWYITYQQYGTRLGLLNTRSFTGTLGDLRRQCR